MLLGMRSPQVGVAFEAGAKVMFLGHSYVTYNASTSPAYPGPLANITSKVTGDAVVTRSMDQRFNLDTWANVHVPFHQPTINYNDVSGAANGFSGATLYDLATNTTMLDYFVAHDPDIVVLILGINDINNAGITLAQMQGWFTTIYNAFNAIDAWMVADTIYPRTNTGGAAIPDGDARLTKLTAYNTWLRDTVSTWNKVKVNDLSPILGDPRPSESYWIQADGLHAQDRAVYAASVNRLPLLQSLVRAGYHTPTNPDPTSNNIMPNQKMSGTGGTKATSGTPPTPTGNVPTGYSVTNFTGTSNVACSIEATDVASYNKLALAISPVNDGTAVHEIRVAQTANVLLSAFSTPLAMGDWLQWMQQIDITAWDGWCQLGATLNWGSSSAALWSTSVDFALNSAGTYIQQTAARTYWMVSEPFQLPFDLGTIDRFRCSSGSPHLSIKYLSNVGGSPTVKLGKPILRKVDSPKNAWGLSYQPVGLTLALTQKRGV